MSFKVEVIADSSGKWVPNGLCFPTSEEAEDFAKDLYGRWVFVQKTRVVTSEDPVNYRFWDGELVRIAHENLVQFGTLQADGTLTDQRQIKQADMLRCPMVIMMPVHYRDDGTCRCDDESHSEMAEWGYTWRDGQWRSS